MRFVAMFSYGPNWQAGYPWPSPAFTAMIVPALRRSSTNCAGMLRSEATA